MSAVAITIHLDDATIEFVDGGSARVRVIDDEDGSVTTFLLIPTHDGIWTVQTGASLISLGTDAVN
jgi:hypothetical protein